MAKRRASKKPSPASLEGNKFDKILKENLETLIPSLERNVFKIKVFESENLIQVKQQTTKEKEPDFLRKAKTNQYPEGCIQHVEFEAKDSKNTDARMLEYVASEHRKHKLPIDLRLVYLLEKPPINVTGKVAFGKLDFSYPVYVLYQTSYREFIDSKAPEDVILSVLANPDGDDKQDIVRLILARLLLLLGDSQELWKFINQLKIFSLLRNLREETEKQVHNMEISQEIVRQIKQDKMYQLGIEQGLEAGEIKKAMVAVRNMLQKKFDIHAIADILEVEKKFVLDVQTQLQKEPEIVVTLSNPRVQNNTIAKRFGVSPVLVEIIRESLT